jgi:membrane-associated phospholipid phosphatase
MTGMYRPLWETITNLGAAGLMLPILALVCAGLWRTGQAIAAVRWLVFIALGAALVLATKIAFLSFGIGNAALDFTGISGHATLATAVLPVWLGWLLVWGRRRTVRVGLLLGLVLGALVAWSRVYLGAHSPSESVMGWLLGAGIACLTLHALDRRIAAPRLAQGAGLVLLLALSPSLSAYLPTHDWERYLALAVSGRGVVYTRSSLRQALRTVPTGGVPATVVAPKDRPAATVKVVSTQVSAS